MTKQTETKYRIRNWPEYNRGLVNRGSLTIWFSEEAIEGWLAKSCGKRGRPKVYSDEAILCALVVKAVYRLPFRALRGFILSVIQLLGLLLPVPCYTRICRRAAELGQQIERLGDKKPTDILDGNSIDGLQNGIKQILNVLNGSPYSGVPKGEEGKKLIQKMTFVLRHIFYLLPHAVAKEKMVNIKALSMAQIAIGGMGCAGGHVQAILSVYQALKQFSPLQAHHLAQSHLNLAHVDLVVAETLDLELQQLRSTIFQTLLTKYVDEYKGDPAHFKNKVLKAIGKIRGIPGAEMADYLDPYEACAPTLTQDQMLKDFDQHYALEKILNYLTEKVRYGSDGVNMNPFIDFLVRHAPEKTDLDDFLIMTFNGKHLKQTFLVQILIIAGHLSY